MKSPWINLTEVAKSAEVGNPCGRGVKSTLAVWFDGRYNKQ